MRNHVEIIVVALVWIGMVSWTTGEDATSTTNVIYLKESAQKTIRLKSVLSLKNADNVVLNSTDVQHRNQKQQKLFWSFKRLYAVPKWAEGETRTLDDLSPTELMISLDTEVQENLQWKYSISSDEPNVDMAFDLIITNITYADSGVYKCNLWNQKTIYYHLIVSSPIEKPTIRYEQATYVQNNMLLESTDVSVKCTSQHSYPYPVVRWFSNNVEIKPTEDNVRHKLVDKETNTIESVLKLNQVNSGHHRANITCKLIQMPVDGEQMWQMSDRLMLNVAFKPIVSVEMFKLNANSPQPMDRIRLTQSNKIFLYETDQETLFSCKFNSNPADKIKIFWKLNNVIQNQGEANNVDVFSWKKRSLPDVKQMNLTCEVQNSIGSTSFTVEVTQLYEPKLKLNKTVYDIDEFSAFRVDCQVDSSPSVSVIEWRKYRSSSHNEGSSNARIDYEVISHDSLLEFKSIKHKENAGYYVCVAQNSMNDSFGLVKLGDRRFQIEIDIRFAPQMNTVWKKVAATSTSTSQNISCITMSNPRPDMAWFKNGQRLNGSQDEFVKYTFGAATSRGKNLFESVLTINNLNDADLNTKYECEARNQLGSNRVSIELVPLSKPDKPTELRSLYVDFMTITLAWSPGFDGGLKQTFIFDLNGTLVELDDQQPVDIDAGKRSKLLKLGPSLVNLTRLDYDTTYVVRIMARNELGSSDWSDLMRIRTLDINAANSFQLPSFESLFLNVPKNRLEYTMRPSVQYTMPVPVCFKFNLQQLNGQNQGESTLSLGSCLPLNENYLKQTQFSFDSLSAAQLTLYKNEISTSDVFNAKLVKSIRVLVCFQAKPSVCAEKATSAIIDTYNKMSHSSLTSNGNENQENGLENVNNNSRGKFSFVSSGSKIPIAIIIGICVCILTLAILLFITVIYCIRKRNFKLCKALLSQAATVDSNSHGKSGQPEPMSKHVVNEKSKEISTIACDTSSSDRRQLASHTNKTFNIDIASISAPMTSTISINGSHLSNSTVSDFQHNNNNNIQLNPASIGNNQMSCKTNSLNSRRAFTAALTATANNIINNSIGKHKINEILVTEDEEQQQKIIQKAAAAAAEKDMIQVTTTSSSSSSSSSASSNTSSTAVSNCSSTNIAPYVYTNSYSPFDQPANQAPTSAFVDQYNNAMCSDSTASNSDPIAINNSLSSNSTTDSPTYGYNLTNNATTTLLAHHHHHHHMYNQVDINTDEVTFIQQQQQHVTFPPLDAEANYTLNKNTSNKQPTNTVAKCKMNKSASNNNNLNNVYAGNEPQTESGYSTPSRPKKVVYEVIV